MLRPSLPILRPYLPVGCGAGFLGPNARLDRRAMLEPALVRSLSRAERADLNLT